jgi:hypothetical protein
MSKCTLLPLRNCTTSLILSGARGVGARGHLEIFDEKFIVYCIFFFVIDRVHRIPDAFLVREYYNIFALSYIHLFFFL